MRYRGINTARPHSPKYPGVWGLFVSVITVLQKNESMDKTKKGCTLQKMRAHITGT